jgi:signal peptidase
MTLARRVSLTLVGLLLIGVVATVAVLWSEGYRVYVVHTGSMVPTYDPGDVVIDRPAGGSYHPGEVITFRHDISTTDVVTHRILSVGPDGIRTKGDANASPDAWTIPFSFVRGREVTHVKDLGYVLVFLEQPSGLAALATGSIGLVLLWGLFFPADPAPARSRPTPRHAGWLVDART